MKKHGCCNNVEPRMEMNMNMNMGMNQCGCRVQPIIEPAITNCVEREFFHEVPHDCSSYG